MDALAKGLPTECLVQAVDLRDPAVPATVVMAAKETFGGVDLVVNNAGATKRGDFLQLTDEDWADGYAMKLFGAMRLSRAAWPDQIGRAHVRTPVTNAPLVCSILLAKKKNTHNH